MFDIGFSELVIIALVALIVLGPQRLPEVARTAGRWAAQARRFMNTVKSDFEREMNTEELAQFRKLQQEIAETRTLVEAPAETLVEQPRPSEATPAPNAVPALEAPANPASATPAADKPVRKPRVRKKAAASTESAASSRVEPAQAQPSEIKPKATARKKHGGTKRTAG